MILRMAMGSGDTVVAIPEAVVQQQQSRRSQRDEEVATFLIRLLRGTYVLGVFGVVVQ
jgi:hypothetical protein